MKSHLALSLGLGVWIFIFLFFIEPFELGRFSLSLKLFLISVYCIIEAVSYIIPLQYQKIVIKQQDNWYYKNEFIFILLLVLVGFIFNYSFYWIAVPHQTKAYSIPLFIELIYGPAILIVLPFVGISRVLISQKREEVIKEKEIPEKVTIQGEGKNEFTKLKLVQLVYVKSADNYVEVYYVEENTLHQKVLRGKISKIHKDFPELIKTHRSYLINPYHFKEFKTESDKFYSLLDYGVKVPVSRTFKKAVIEHCN